MWLFLLINAYLIRCDQIIDFCDVATCGPIPPFNRRCGPILTKKISVFLQFQQYCTSNDKFFAWLGHVNGFYKLIQRVWPIIFF